MPEPVKEIPPQASKRASDLGGLQGIEAKGGNLMD